jgi:hypothetical protein
MTKAKVGLCAILLAAAMAGSALVLTRSGPTASAAPPVVDNHWRFHDGHWSYWHEGDKRWYYTDGAHWFWNDGGAWKLYAFDHGFGKEAFVHGEYKVPVEREKIIVPHHGVYHP